MEDVKKKQNTKEQQLQKFCSKMLYNNHIPEAAIHRPHFVQLICYH